MKQKVGMYTLGCRKINLYFDPELNGGNFASYEDDNHPRITVGGASKSWNQVVTILLHEALESSISDLGCRFIPDVDFARANDGYLFHMDHAKFSEAVGRSGYFMADCLPDLATVFNNSKEEK